jgi:hypothetical protein
MKTAALMLAALLLVSCEQDRPAPPTNDTSANYVDTDHPWDDGEAK